MLTPEQHRAMVAADMTEAVLQARCIAAATSLGWRYFHAPANRPGGRAGRVQTVVPGFPDLMLLHRVQRRVMYRELKTEKGRTTPEQREWIADLEAVGADVGVWRPSDYLDGTVARQLALPPRRPIVVEPFPPSGRPVVDVPLPHDRQEPARRAVRTWDDPCPTCGASGVQECATPSGRDHRSRRDLARPSRNV